MTDPDGELPVPGDESENPEEGDGTEGTNLMRAMLEVARRSYVEEHGEQPSDEFVEDARTQLVRSLAQRGRDEHRVVYDALADE